MATCKGVYCPFVAAIACGSLAILGAVFIAPLILWECNQTWRDLEKGMTEFRSLSDGIWTDVIKLGTEKSKRFKRQYSTRFPQIALIRDIDDDDDSWDSSSYTDTRDLYYSSKQEYNPTLWTENLHDSEESRSSSSKVPQPVRIREPGYGPPGYVYPSAAQTANLALRPGFGIVNPPGIYPLPDFQQRWNPPVVASPAIQPVVAGPPVIPVVPSPAIPPVVPSVPRLPVEPSPVIPAVIESPAILPLEVESDRDEDYSLWYQPRSLQPPNVPWPAESDSDSFLPPIFPSTGLDRSAAERAAQQAVDRALPPAIYPVSAPPGILPNPIYFQKKQLFIPSVGGLTSQGQSVPFTFSDGKLVPSSAPKFHSAIPGLSVPLSPLSGPLGPVPNINYNSFNPQGPVPPYDPSKFNYPGESQAIASPGFAIPVFSEETADPAPNRPDGETYWYERPQEPYTYLPTPKPYGLAQRPEPQKPSLLLPPISTIQGVKVHPPSRNNEEDNVYPPAGFAEPGTLPLPPGLSIGIQPPSEYVGPVVEDGSIGLKQTFTPSPQVKEGVPSIPSEVISQFPTLPPFPSKTRFPSPETRIETKPYRKNEISGNCNCNADNRCPAGPPGPPGPDGVDGEDGEDGEDGRDGDDAADMKPIWNRECVVCPGGGPGFKGRRGPAGKAGPVGFIGRPGEPGRDGGFGAKGPKGIRGREGPRGRRGQPGPVAPPSYLINGMKGPPGIRGSKGEPGAEGLRGPRGLAGPAGERGRRGFYGRRGPLGPHGPAGPRGPPTREKVYCDCPFRRPLILGFIRDRYRPQG